MEDLATRMGQAMEAMINMMEMMKTEALNSKKAQQESMAKLMEKIAEQKKMGGGERGPKGQQDVTTIKAFSDLPKLNGKAEQFDNWRFKMYQFLTKDKNYIDILNFIEESKVEVTLENAELNNLKDRIEAVTAEGFDAPEIAARAPYDLIFANILAGPLTELARHVAQALKPGGRVILSGLLVQQEDQVREAYEQAGLAQETSESIDDWATLVMRKPAPDA